MEGRVFYWMCDHCFFKASNRLGQVETIYHLYKDSGAQTLLTNFKLELALSYFHASFFFPSLGLNHLPPRPLDWEAVEDERCLVDIFKSSTSAPCDVHFCLTLATSNQSLKLPICILLILLEFFHLLTETVVLQVPLDFLFFFINVEVKSLKV